jgi:formylglycine-generating enzyme required for sulfatase activity
MQARLIACAMLGLLAAVPAAAQPSANGFIVRHEMTIAAAPARVYDALVHDVGLWWNPDHTFSGNARNLSIDARPGGCFCETLPNGGGVEHLRVINVAPNEMLRLSGALGPLQGSGVSATLTFTFMAVGEATRVSLVYSVGGFMDGGLARMEAPVSAVLLEQVQRLKAFVESDGATRVAIPGGTFLMGTPADAIPMLRDRYGVRFPGVFENEAPRHRVTVRAFLLDRREVTKADFAAFVGAVPQWRKQNVAPALQNGHYLEDWTGDAYPGGEDRLPVVFVTWHAAEAYCAWRGGRLPTEAEWEYAARAGGDAEFPWGDEMPTAGRANFAASGKGAPVATGSYAPNAFGLFDMSGNVWELMLDAWVEQYPAGDQVNPAAGGAIRDADLPAVTGRRALRGGSFGGAPVNLRTRWRDSHEVTNAVAFVGFRCAYPSAR